MTTNTIKRYGYAGRTLLVLLLLSLMATSCNKLVDAGEPKSSLTTDEVFANSSEAASAIAGMYSQMMTNSGIEVFSNGGLTLYCGLSADELQTLNGVSAGEDYLLYSNKLTYATAETGTVLWSPAYNVIYTANSILEGLANSAVLDSATKKQYGAEAKLVRAFCHFYLTNLYGDIPLLTETNFNKTTSMARSPQADVYKQIISDLKEAEDSLPADYAIAGGERVRPNKFVASALLARAYLYQKDYVNAEKEATAVIGSSLYSLTPSLSNVFLKNSTEAIWQLKQAGTYAPFNATWDGNKFIPNFLFSTFSASDLVTVLDSAYFAAIKTQLYPSYYMSAQLKKAFEGGDKRKSTWAVYMLSPKTAPYYSDTNYFVNKYISKAASVTSVALTQYYMLVRLAELYLIRAEARAYNNDLTGSAADINVIRTRAGLANTTAGTQSALVTAVMQERRVELFAEFGHRWLDLKRTGQADAVLGAITDKQPWYSYQTLYPIPTNDITADPNLTQNTGY